MKWVKITEMKPDFIRQCSTHAVLPDSLFQDLQQINQKDAMAPWRISEAYMRHGFLPPLEWCDLPVLPDYTRTRWWVMAGCIQSCKLAQEQSLALYKKLKGVRIESKEMYQERGELSTID